MREFWTFAYKQLQSSSFALLIFAALAISPLVPLSKYDFLLLFCLAVQISMVKLGWESHGEARMISVFHLLGLALELYKVRSGSWSYPEFAYSKFGGVPLYSGFMYASVASYILQAWRRLDLQFERMPSAPHAWSTVAAIYANFIGNRWFPDSRLLVFALLAFFFGRSEVSFLVTKKQRKMPMLVAFALIGFFVYVAENLCTLLGAWQYPHQAGGWALVHPSKITSWTLMVVIAFVVVWRWRNRFATEAQATATETQVSNPIPSVH